MHKLSASPLPCSRSVPSRGKRNFVSHDGIRKRACNYYSFPVDPSPKDLKQKAMAVKFPFDYVSISSMKLKHTPIELSWKLREGSSPTLSPRQGFVSAHEKQRKPGEPNLQVGLDCRPHWFRPLPKVRIIPGILGSGPGTRHAERIRCRTLAVSVR
jgi:hypothetical protein